MKTDTIIGILWVVTFVLVLAFAIRAGFPEWIMYDVLAFILIGISRIMIANSELDKK